MLRMRALPAGFVPSGGLGEMTRRKREIIGLTNERDFPHLVELAVSRRKAFAGPSSSLTRSTGTNASGPTRPEPTRGRAIVYSILLLYRSRRPEQAPLRKRIPRDRRDTDAVWLSPHHRAAASRCPSCGTPRQPAFRSPPAGAQTQSAVQ